MINADAIAHVNVKIESTGGAADDWEDKRLERARSGPPAYLALP